MRDFVLTSSSVTDGHPDKLCDCISDAIVDAYLTRDEDARVSAECAIASGIVFLATHVASKASADLTSIVQTTVRDAGYHDQDFNPEKVTVLSAVSKVARTEDRDEWSAYGSASVNATVFGYACQHTKEMMPLPIVVAHRLVRRLHNLRTSEELPLLHPDGQTQVSIRFQARVPVAVEGITLNSALRSGVGNGDAQEVLDRRVIRPVLDELDIALSKEALVNINPFGPSLPGGPTRHAGLTGRKNDIDTYGGYSRHGGAALSGKDPSRVDRLGAYAARYAAKNIVAARLASECEVQISYAMGRSEPLSVEVDTFGSGKVPDQMISKALLEVIDFRAEALNDRFQLRGLPRKRHGRFFADLGVLGHLGRLELDLPWEGTDAADALASAV